MSRKSVPFSEAGAWHKYYYLLSGKVRTCRSLHECCLCMSSIVDGEQYYDKGYGKRAHAECVVALLKEANV